MMEIQDIDISEVPESLALKILTLENLTWPPKVADERPDAERLKDYYEKRPERRTFYVLQEDELIAHAELFKRTIYTEDSQLDIWALATVIVAESTRGTGLGRKLVEACFRFVEKSDRDVCLFQTGVPGFYQKLNCGHVHSRFINRTNTENPQKNPFWEDDVMIYPAGYDWPSGTIDLNGKAY